MQCEPNGMDDKTSFHSDGVIHTTSHGASEETSLLSDYESYYGTLQQITGAAIYLQQTDVLLFWFWVRNCNVFGP